MCSPNKKTPFRLEIPDKISTTKRKPQLIYTKTQYQPAVKITDWQKSQESSPLDNNPYCPGNLNFFLSHYRRCGNSPDAEWKSTTHSTLEQLHLKKHLDKLNQNPTKYMVNYFTYKDTLACDTDLCDRICPQLCAPNYETTMQTSYTPPYPYIMERFSYPKIPFLQNRKFKLGVQEPTFSEHKFYDDGYKYQASELQEVKGFRSVSYNPMLYTRSDGTLPKERKQKCVQLDF